MLIAAMAFAQVEGFKFNSKVDITTSPVKDQNRTGTCWSFATTSFIETELIRMGNPVYDISEMYFVRYAYEQKAKDYVRFHGTNNFGQGGQAHDVMNVIREHGMVTEAEYPGLNYGEESHVHGEMVEALKGFLDAVVKNPNRKLTTAWFNAFKGILDAYLGVAPDPSKSELASVKFNPDDYVELTSFSHLPFYQNVMLEIPDNWSHDFYYNLPLDELMEVISYALNNGYSVCWDGDVSEKSFSYKNGVALLPVTKTNEIAGSDKAQWVGLTDKDLKDMLKSFNSPVPEVSVNQENRQQNFDNLTTTDDHLMHLTGIATDQNGTTYFKTKNSWGADGVYNGYLYMSESYVRMKTIAIMVHRDAIPKNIAKKLGI
ncbi:aminopeptidase [Tenuifilum thalassicum]|uniref:Aminopeptidase n=2 Tax=Tenuifilum thalassicum TaxID=2590900 RepID=A0A7D4CIG8_9BACT|nr:aminopeptidase [Tenuifilum thalassicum]